MDWIVIARIGGLICLSISLGILIFVVKSITLAEYSSRFLAVFILLYFNYCVFHIPIFFSWAEYIIPIAICAVGVWCFVKLKDKFKDEFFNMVKDSGPLVGVVIFLYIARLLFSIS